MEKHLNFQKVILKMDNLNSKYINEQIEGIKKTVDVDEIKERLSIISAIDPDNKQLIDQVLELPVNEDGEVELTEEEFKKFENISLQAKLSSSYIESMQRGDLSDTFSSCLKQYVDFIPNQGIRKIASVMKVSRTRINDIMLKQMPPTVEEFVLFMSYLETYTIYKSDKIKTRVSELRKKRLAKKELKKERMKKRIENTPWKYGISTSDIDWD